MTLKELSDKIGDAQDLTDSELELLLQELDKSRNSDKEDQATQYLALGEALVNEIQLRNVEKS